MQLIPESHSSRVRGLKSIPRPPMIKLRYVALFTSAWVEILYVCCEGQLSKVALFTSAWVEIKNTDHQTF